MKARLYENVIFDIVSEGNITLTVENSFGEVSMKAIRPQVYLGDDGNIYIVERKLDGNRIAMSVVKIMDE